MVSFQSGVQPNIQRYGFLLLPNFSFNALSSAVDPLRLANMAMRRTVFEYVTIGIKHEAVVSSDGISVLPDEEMGKSSKRLANTW